MEINPQILSKFVSVLAALASVSGAAALAGDVDDSAMVNEPGEIEIVSMAADRSISEAEAYERLSWQAQVPALASLARQRLGRGFGGIWVDVYDGDRIKIGVVRSAESEAGGADWAIAESRLAHAIDFVEVDRSWDELNKANLWLAQEIVALGPNISVIAGLRPERNVVELQTARGERLTSAARELIARAKSWLGDGLVVGTFEGKPEARACSYPYCDPSLRGGNRITNSGRQCTNAFVARSKVDSKMYQFTAGHCVESPFNDNWSTLFTDGSSHVIGARHNSIFGAAGDMAILRINNVPGWDPENWVHVTSGPPDTTQNTTYSILSEGFSHVGMRICTTGAFYGRSDCGEVTQLGLTMNYEGRTVTNLGRGNFCGTQGDSGAPMYASHRAYGLQVAGFSECDSVYQGIIAAESQMNVNIIH